jgi:protease secretion system outer membrane protein
MAAISSRARATWLKAAAAAVAGACLLHSGAASAVGLLQAYQAALQNDPTYRMAGFDYQAGQEYQNIGRSQLLPNLSANYSASRVGADVTAPNIFGAVSTAHHDYISRVSSITLRQSVLNLDAIARYKQGKAQTTMSVAIYDSAAQEVGLRLTSAYLDALFANEQLKLALGQREALREQRLVNDRLFEKGEGTKTDMLETQAKLDSAEADVLEAQDGLTTNLAALSSIVGADVAALDELAPEFRLIPLSPGSFEEWQALALKNNPDLSAATLGVEVAKQEVNKSRAGHAPRLDFIASYSKNNSETLNTYNQDSTQRALGIQLTVPLYAGGYVNAVTRQAVAGQEKARADLQNKTDKIMVDLRKQYSLVLSSVARIRALDKAVESGQLLVKATEQSIKGGVRINLDLLNARQQLYTSQRDLARARYGYLLGTLRLRADAGTLGLDDVREIAAYFR